MKQMNDIEFLEAQYKRIKSEIAVAKRLDWMRRGIGIYKNRKPLDQVRPNIFVKSRSSANSKPEGRQVGSKSSVSVAESVSVELTSDGRVIINGKIIESEATTVPEKPDASVTGQPKK